MWFLKHQPLVDNTDVIFLDESGAQALPLFCDQTLYLQSRETIRSILRAWIMQDMNLATSAGGRPLDGSLAYRIRNVDLKYLAYPDQLANFLDCMQDTGTSFSGSRLMDAFVNIYLNVPIEITEYIKGKFLYGMLYGITSTNDREFPTKQEWVTTLKGYPWIPFLCYIQEMIDTEEEIVRLIQLARNQPTQVNLANG